MRETAVESRALASLMYTLSAGVSDMVKGTSNLIKINDRFDVSWHPPSNQVGPFLERDRGCNLHRPSLRSRVFTCGNMPAYTILSRLDHRYEGAHRQCGWQR